MYENQTADGRSFDGAAIGRSASLRASGTLASPHSRRTLDTVPDRLEEIARRLEGTISGVSITADFLGGPVPESKGGGEVGPVSGTVDAIHARIDHLGALAARLEEELGRLTAACR